MRYSVQCKSVETGWFAREWDDVQGGDHKGYSKAHRHACKVARRAGRPVRLVDRGVVIQEYAMAEDDDKVLEMTEVV